MLTLRSFSKIIFVFFLSFNFSNSKLIDFSNKKKTFSNFAITTGLVGLLGLETQIPYPFPWAQKYNFEKNKERKEYLKKNGLIRQARKALCAVMCAGIITRMYAQ